MEVLASVSVRTEPCLMIVFTDLSLIILVKSLFRSQLIFSVGKATIISPLAFSVGLKVFTNFSLILPGVLKVF